MIITTINKVVEKKNNNLQMNYLKKRMKKMKTIWNKKNRMNSTEQILKFQVKKKSLKCPKSTKALRRK